MGKKTYDDGQYRVVHRVWMGLLNKYGGNANAGHTPWNTTDATSGTLITGWYPRGPVEIVKFGAFVMTAMSNASNDLCPLYLKTRGASGSTGATLNVKSTATDTAVGTFASIETFTVAQIKAGEYAYVRWGTPKTDKGTAANTASTTGTFALFIDYSPRYNYDDNV
jgi:hypothetical protein